VADVRAAFRPAAGGTRRLVAHAPPLAAAKRELERFLFEEVYRCERVLAIRVPAQKKLADLFNWYVAHPESLPPRFRERAARYGIPRSTADYIAGMTDRFLELDHARRRGA
jgi:dGTPase